VFILTIILVLLVVVEILVIVIWDDKDLNSQDHKVLCF